MPMIAVRKQQAITQVWPIPKMVFKRLQELVKLAKNMKKA